VQAHSTAMHSFMSNSVVNFLNKKHITNKVRIEGEKQERKFEWGDNTENNQIKIHG
jgi:hypothetical protein